MKQSIGNAVYAGLYGVVINEGNGPFISDVDENMFLDFLAGASVVTVGYSRKDVLDTFVEVSGRIQHT